MKKVFILIVTVFFPLYSYAQQKIFYLNMGVEYNDNIYLTNTNKESDLITYISPGIRWEKLLKKTYLSFYYAPTWAIYYSHTDRNTLRHDILTEVFHYFNPHVKLYMRNHYIKSEEPIEKIGETISQTVRTTRNTYERDRLKINLEWKYSKSNLAKIGYLYRFLENKDPAYEDSKESTIYLNLSHWFTVRHGINIDFKYTKNRVSEKTEKPYIPDFDGYDFDISYNCNVNKRTRIGFGYYITKKGFLEKAIADRYVKMHFITISHKISPFTRIYLGLFKFRPYGIRGMDKDFTGYELKLEKRLRPIKRKNIFLQKNISFYLKKSWDENYLEARRRGFTRYTEVGFHFMEQLNRTTIFEHNFSYRRNYYFLFPKKDKTYSFSTRLKKNIKPNLAIELTYKHKERTSPIFYYNYKYNSITIFFHYFFKYK